MTAESTLLLIDTVGDAPGAVLSRGDRILASAEFPLRSASAALLPELRRMLSVAKIAVRNLNGIGVVSGPGSFTGVRTGLAMAKGLCEVAGIPLASISRLQMLAEAADLQEGFAVLDAGRGSLYIREQRRTEPAHERLATIEEFKRTAAGAPIVVAEKRTAELLAQLAPVVRELQPSDLLRPVERCLAAGGTNVAAADANYVLPESEIYTRPRHSPSRGGETALMASRGIILRPADSADLQRILALTESAPGAPRWSASIWRQILRSPSTASRLVLIAESANECVGFGVLGLAADTAEIESLAVSADWRRQGIARQLCSDLLNWARARHAIEASLEVRLSNIPARVLYESLGFQKNAVRRGYYRDPEEDALVMTMVL